MDANALVTQPVQALTVVRDADVYHLGAQILSTLDRLDATGQFFSRITVHLRRVVVFDLPDLPYIGALELVEHDRFGERLTQLTGAAMIAIREHRSGQGCLIIVELPGQPVQTAPRRERSSLTWCAQCNQLMPYGHTHAEASCAKVC